MLKTLALALLVTAVSVELANANPNGPVKLVIDPHNKHYATLSGNFPHNADTLNTILAAMRKYKTSQLFLDSHGGSVGFGLALGNYVSDANVNTTILKGATCASACTLVFIAGKTKRAYGELGVHRARIWGSDTDEFEDLFSDQMNVSLSIAHAMDRYHVHTDFVKKWSQTPGDEMYFFSEAEKRKFGYLP